MDKQKDFGELYGAMTLLNMSINALNQTIEDSHGHVPGAKLLIEKYKKLYAEMQGEAFKEYQSLFENLVHPLDEGD